jgi:hypothetical protein
MIFGSLPKENPGKIPFLMQW